MMKHKKINGQLLQEALKENGIQVKPASGLAKPGKLVLTGEDGKAYAVGKNLEVARVQTEDPERIVLKASVKDAAGQHVAQVEKAVVRTVEFETASHGQMYAAGYFACRFSFLIRIIFHLKINCKNCCATVFSLYYAVIIQQFFTLSKGNLSLLPTVRRSFCHTFEFFPDFVLPLLLFLQILEQF